MLVLVSKTLFICLLFVFEFPQLCLFRHCQIANNFNLPATKKHVVCIANAQIPHRHRSANEKHSENRILWSCSVRMHFLVCFCGIWGTQQLRLFPNVPKHFIIHLPRFQIIHWSLKKSATKTMVYVANAQIPHRPQKR